MNKYLDKAAKGFMKAYSKSEWGVPMAISNAILLPAIYGYKYLPELEVAIWGVYSMSKLLGHFHTDQEKSFCKF